MNKEIVDFIDLTGSFTLANHSKLNNQVISVDSDDSLLELVDDDFSAKEDKPPAKQSLSLMEKSMQLYTAQQALKLKRQKSKKLVKSKILGECPICCDELGKNPLASTKCGHVFCIQCIDKSLTFNKTCPSCRSKLVGKSAYHPIYLDLLRLSNKK